MRVQNQEIAEIFKQLADLLEIEGANPFRVNAYRNAARTVLATPTAMADLLQQGQDLSELPAIGDDLAAKIKTIVETGGLPLLEEVAGRTPRELIELLHIEGLGPTRVNLLYSQLGIRNLDDLGRALRGGKIRELPGFGEKLESKIGAHLEHFSGAAPRMKLIAAETIAEALVDYLRACSGVKEVIVAGSYRRRRATVGDLDILVTVRSGAPVIRHFTEYEDVATVLAKGTTRCRVRLSAGINVDLCVVPQISYGAALHYFTGSRAHTIHLRKLGVKKGLKINEYGVFRGRKRLAGKTEKEVFAAVGLPYIVPELREDRGEFSAAQSNTLPELVELEHIRGDLHCHTRATDGHNSLAEMAKAAAERGYEYVSINDHSRHLTVVHGLDKKQLLGQIRAIDKLNDELSDIVILKSCEVDILEDGSLDLPDSVLKRLDFTVCAIHYKFDLPREKQTERILRAMDNPYFNILAHPSGRLINVRAPYAIDMRRIIDAAAQRKCILEVNAQPDRMDLTDEMSRAAKEAGVGVSIATDAHSIANLDYMRFGVDQARRGWLGPEDVINTRPLGQLRQIFKRH